jgi:hypothetical protein
MIRANLVLTALLLWPAAASAMDALLLQQTVLPDEQAAVQLLVDRDRVALAQLRQAGKDSYVVELTLVGDPNLTVRVTCRDLAGGRQVIDALRPRGAQILDVSGRCWF